jgi:hypothetical protein
MVLLLKASGVKEGVPIKFFPFDAYLASIVLH